VNSSQHHPAAKFPLQTDVVLNLEDVPLENVQDLAGVVQVMPINCLAKLILIAKRDARDLLKRL